MSAAAHTQTVRYIREDLTGLGADVATAHQLASAVVDGFRTGEPEVDDLAGLPEHARQAAANIAFRAAGYHQFTFSTAGPNPDKAARRAAHAVRQALAGNH